MSQLAPVTFHGDTIFCLTYGTPAKPIVENLGLGWASQSQKLNSNKARWGVTIIVIPSESGEQQMLCLPARTLPVSNIYRDRVKELERLEAKFMAFAGETRSRLSELNAEYIRLNQGAFAALLRTLPAAHPGDVDRLSSALSAQSYDAYNWIDAGLSRMRLAIVSARAANRTIAEAN